MSRRRLLTLLPAPLILGVVLVTTSPPASAAQPQVGLGTATSFAVLAGSTVINTGASTIAGDVGLAPGTAVVGFPPGLVTGGSIHAADAVALQAESDLTTAYVDAAGRTPRVDKTGVDLGGQTLLPGVYNASSSMALTGTVTLDAQGDPAAVFIFQAGSTLITASNATVALIGSAQPCNVFWQVTSSATLGTDTTFVGSVLALTDITAQTGASIEGRLLARNGQVVLDTNDITRPGCATTPTTTPATATPTPSVTPSATATVKPSPGGGNGGNGNGNGDNGGAGGTGNGNSPGSQTSAAGASPSGSGTDGPVVPIGHPETGRAAVPGPDPRLWLVGVLACLGAGTIVTVGSRRRALVHHP